MSVVSTGRGNFKGRGAGTSARPAFRGAPVRGQVAVGGDGLRRLRPSATVTADDTDTDTLLAELGAVESELKRVADLSSTKSSVRQLELKEKQRRQDVTDSEYWVAVCFESRAQKEEALAKLKAAGIDFHGEDKFVDGRVLCQALGVVVTPHLISNRAVNISRRWLKHVVDSEG